MLKALEEINLRDLKTIAIGLAMYAQESKHDDERALARITFNKIANAIEEQEQWLIKEYS